MEMHNLRASPPHHGTHSGRRPGVVRRKCKTGGGVYLVRRVLKLRDHNLVTCSTEQVTFAVNDNVLAAAFSVSTV
jgi:hypothetical protein